MVRDMRGNPGRYTLKNQPRLRLADLLRRRRMQLQQFLAEFGITTYEGLCERCRRMGVAPPELQDFEAVIPPTAKVNNPTEGVVVLEAPPVIAESTGQEIDVSSSFEAPEASQKKARRKKDIPASSE